MLRFSILFFFFFLIRVMVLRRPKRYAFTLGILEDIIITGLTFVVATFLYLAPLRILWITALQALYSVDALMMYRLHIRFFRRFIREFYRPLYWKKVPYKELAILALPIVGFCAINIGLEGYNILDIRWLILIEALSLLLYLTVESILHRRYHKDWANLLFLWIRPHTEPQQKTHKNLSYLIDPNEQYTPCNSEYPLLRNTLNYKGSKSWSVDLPPEDPPHICLIFLESLRAKNVGHLGCSHKLTSHLDALSEQGICFSRFYANGPLSLHGLFSSLYGIPPCYAPFHIGAQEVYNLPVRGLHDIFREKGYRTAHIQNSDPAPGCLTPFLQRHQVPVFDEKHIQETFSKHKRAYEPEDRSLWDFVHLHFQESKEPTFTTILTSSSHYPFSTPMHYKGPTFSDEPFDLYRNYLKTLWYTDQQLGRFMEKAPKNTLFWILGDHGYQLNEHGIYHNTAGLYEECIHVPSIIYAPGFNLGPQKIDSVSSQCDILPTLLDLMGFSAKHHSIGRSLMRKHPKPHAFCMNPFQEGSYAWIEGETKLHKQQEDVDFYNVVADPQEQETLPPDSLITTTARERYNTLRSLFKASQFSNDHLHHLAIASDPFPSDAMVIEQIQKLRHLSSVDLSHCQTLSATTLQKLPPHLKHANLSNTLFSDKDLTVFLQQQKELSSLDISHCGLLSGLPTQWNENLESLNLAGLSNCTTKYLQYLPPKLRYLNLTDWKLDDEGIKHLTSRVESLRTLHISAEGANILPLIAHCYSLRELVCHGPISGEVLHALPSRHLYKLEITNAEQLNEEALIQMRRFNLRLLQLTRMEALSDQNIEILLHLPLETLILSQMPHVTQKCLETLKKHRLQLIVFAECPQVPLMDEVRYIPITEKVTQVQRIQSFPCNIHSPY